jgi:hypothetical protein
MSNDRNFSPARRLAANIASFVEECNYAQRRALALRMAPDRYLFSARGAPADYAEFLLWTSGPLPHEPSARARAGGARQPW